MGDLAFAQSEKLWTLWNLNFTMVPESLHKLHILPKNFTVMKQKAFPNILHNSQVYSKLFLGLAKQTVNTKRGKLHSEIKMYLTTTRSGGNVTLLPFLAKRQIH